MIKIIKIKRIRKIKRKKPAKRIEIPSGKGILPASIIPRIQPNVERIRLKTSQ